MLPHMPSERVHLQIFILKCGEANTICAATQVICHKSTVSMSRVLAPYVFASGRALRGYCVTATYDVAI